MIASSLYAGGGEASAGAGRRCFGIPCALATTMSPAQLAPTARIVRPSRTAQAQAVNGQTQLSATEADRLIRDLLTDAPADPHADTERNPVTRG